MGEKPTYEQLEQRIKKLGGLLAGENRTAKIEVSDINIAWDSKRGTCTFENLPVAMMWVDTTLAGLMSGMQAMVGTKRFSLALQSEGRKSVEADWTVISQFSDFRDGFMAIANIAAVAGWGNWQLTSLDMEKKEGVFRAFDSWEGGYQKALGAYWGSGMLAGKMADDSLLREPITIIKSSGQKAAAIVQDLLTLARRGVAATEVTNLNHVVDEYLKSSECKKLRTYYPNSQIECNLEADLLPILASPIHLSNTIMNLVSNAAEAISGEGRITISTTNCYVDNPMKGYDKVKEGDYVVLTVADNGVGISPTDLEKIFEPFYTKKVMGRSGTGLGMAVVWGTVKDHNGYIDIESTEGEGTVFNLYFPVTREKAEKESVPTSMKEYMGNGERILVIDDMKDQRKIATTLLSKLKYSVDVVSSGEEAVEYVKNNSPDLLILDMIMDPGMDGLDTYKKILELHPKQKAIIASGFSETERVKEAQKLGAGQYVKKPYTLEKIGLAVEAELSR